MFLVARNEAQRQKNFHIDPSSFLPPLSAPHFLIDTDPQIDLDCLLIKRKALIEKAKLRVIGGRKTTVPNLVNC